MAIVTIAGGPRFTTPRDRRAIVEVAVAKRMAIRGAFSATIEDPWYAELWRLPEWKVRVAAVYRIGAR